MDRSLILLTSNDRPVPVLCKLLIFFKGPTNDVQEIIDFTQQHWLRKPHEERWQQQERFEEHRQQLMPLFYQLGLINAYTPLEKHYTYALILGGKLDTVRQRFASFKGVYHQGVKIDFLIVLGSQRPLDEREEKREKLLDFHNPYAPIRRDWQWQGTVPKTEMEMMRMIGDQVEIPAELSDKIIFIESPMKKNAQGELRRPNTADTIKDWLATGPQAGSCLGISTQPFVGYQNAVIRTYLPQDFFIETIGQKAEERIAVVTYLDTIARWLYQENIRRKGE